jgi:para-nitrobenzyl esterase
MTVEQFTGQSIDPEIGKLMGILGSEPTTGEDCLVLNVWTPTVDSTSALPVLVWLHGGGWSVGSASWPLYEFDNLARDNDVVVVGLNHRVGVLGFLDLSPFGDEFADSGNVGMLDIVAALGWVRDNIGEFGGNPRNVTVFGESGGGAKTTTLLAEPTARGLFHKAYAMSGALLKAQTPEHSNGLTNDVFEHLGIAQNAHSLQKLENERLIEAEIASRGSGGLVGRNRGFGPVLCPSLPQHPYEAIRQGSARDVTVVLGCTTDEMLAFIMGDSELWSLDAVGLRQRVGGLLDTDADQILRAYQAARPGDSPTSLWIAIATDARMRIPHIRIAEAKLEAGGSPVYMYLFGWGFPDPTGRIRSPHGLDMPYFFDNLDKAPAADGPHAAPLVRATSGSLVELARVGDPNHESLPMWPQYSLPHRATLRFDVESTVVLDPFGAERLAWDGVETVGLGAETMTNSSESS